MRTHQSRARGFTLVELMVVLGVIIILVSILLPVAGRVRTAAREAETQALVDLLHSACEAYQKDFGAYPGPFHNDNLLQYTNAWINKGNASLTIAPQVGSPATPVLLKSGGADFPTATQCLTQTENAMLGLFGGLKIAVGGDPSASDYLQIKATGFTYEPANVGTGPVSLNPGAPQRWRSYITFQIEKSTWGACVSDTTKKGLAGELEEMKRQYPEYCGDSPIPEMVDAWPDPMPILILRANRGNRGVSSADNKTQFNDSEFRVYTAGQTLAITNVFGSGRDFSGSLYYLKNPNLTAALTDDYKALQMDAFVILAPGADRRFGSKDDITNFMGLK